MRKQELESREIAKENPQARNCAGDFTADKAREHRGAECTKVHEHRRMRAATQSDGKSTSRKSGDNSEEVTPVPISNTVVKLLSADDTWWEAAWESRTLPVFYLPKYFTIAIQNEDSICCLFFFWQRLYFPKGWFPSILYAASPQGRKP